MSSVPGESAFDRVVRLQAALTRAEDEPIRQVDLTTIMRLQRDLDVAERALAREVATTSAGRWSILLTALALTLCVVVIAACGASTAMTRQAASTATSTEPCARCEAAGKRLKAVEANRRALERQHDPNEQLCIAAGLSPEACKANREYAEAHTGVAP